MDLSLRITILVILVAMTGLAYGSDGESGVIELTKEESLGLINLAFMARAAQADLQEAERVAFLANQQFQVALGLLLEAKGVTLDTHNVNLRNGMLEPLEGVNEESAP